MQDDFYPSDEYETPPEPTISGYGQRPDDVVDDTTLTLAQKRAILASWASDARAVIDAPALRQLDNGDVVDIDSILDALKRLDGIAPERPQPRRRGEGHERRHRPSLARRLRRLIDSRRSDDDDDDPPPCPSAARLPRPMPSLSGAAVPNAA
ncbi:hypothetical protein [Devosia riboflavina]|uniref:hypothetical protein n=1 Tax=Devosia riboflavina TaxID=46914 RepID=UPI00068D295F|nr:hypothetical protein [Devosia riboflavina]